MTLLACRGLSRRPMFTDRSLALEAGDLVVLRGPTGCGKSTLLRAIADLDPVDEGTVELEGRDRASVPAPRWRAAVRYLQQDAPRLAGTVREDLARFARIARRGRDDAPATLPPSLELAGELDTGRLSGGESQLLALHRAFLGEPRVLLLDEPTSALDAERARAFERFLVDWLQGGGHGRRAAVWVSHDAELAGRVGAREELLP